MADPAGADATDVAAEWCAAARQLPGQSALMAFGTRDSVLVLFGETRRLCLQRYGEAALDKETLWARVDDFCRPGAVTAGYIGFDAVWADGTERPAATSPTLHVWEPQGVLRIDAAGGAARTMVLEPSAALSALRPAPIASSEALALGEFDADSHDFRQSVSRTIESIRDGDVQRLTLARRVDLPPDIDLLASFAAAPAVDAHGIGRSFYLRTEALELAGHSPELLGRGDDTNFTCFKLSGTGRRDANRATDERLRAGLLGDPKVLDEHALAIRATREALEAVGTVTNGRMQICDRIVLRHLMTPLDVAVRPGASWSAILRAILPTGAQPRASGLRALDGLERISRGPYYGVLGLRLPDGRFEFSQVLRTLFRDASGVHTFVGAAVTAGSTAEGESAETRLKLGDVTAKRSQCGVGEAASARIRSITASRPAMTASS